MDHSRLYSLHGSEKEFSQIYSNFSISVKEGLNLKDCTQLEAIFTESFPDPRFQQHGALIPLLKSNGNSQFSYCKKKVKTELGKQLFSFFLTFFKDPSPTMQKFLLGDKTEKNNDQDVDLEDEDDWNLMMEQESNQESVESGKKRGKYKVYTLNEKATILNFVT